MDELIVCKKCGAKNLPTQDFCNNCGTVLEKIVKEEKKKKRINIDFNMLLNIIFALLSFIFFIIGVFNSYKIISNGFLVADNSLKIKIFCIIESISPILFLINGILIFKSRKELKTKIVNVILPLIGLLLSLIPLIMVPDIFYMILGAKKYSPIVLCPIMYGELIIYYLIKFIKKFIKIDKKIIKILFILLRIILMIVVFIILSNLLQPSEYLIPDFE